ncbi:ABC transporter substrate-binding protein [Mesorhizobium captivum]|uniref:ABC transporter substrate-binding protein n=1 Tax=Mesorhizobium captivum TaxID=3072319 RepID=UPI002A23DA49|nr:ABC transporter substrate-binding protein [Mesorhizobium sp. VK23E]MDX8516423.1 ABC transporter substrate-binding protein [Mesorhizobium sp. VK23E]
MTNCFRNVDRRTFLKRGAVLGGGVIAAGMPLSNAIWAAEGKVLKAAAPEELATLDPGFYTSTYEVNVMNCLYLKLTRYKPGSQWGWDLEAAEKIEQVDPTHIRFRLKKGIKFTSDHGEMTANDVKFSLERIIKHKSDSMADLGSLDHVEIEDDHTGVIVFKTPYVPVWTLVFPYATGHIVSEQAVMKATKDGGNFGMKPPAFSGPYVLADWKQNQYTLLTRNPDWSGPKPGFDEIRIIPITDTKTAERAYLAGDVDFATISPDSLATFKSNPPPDTKVEEHPSLRYIWLGMNMDNPKLKDINVRKAIQWAINVPQILDGAYAGQANVATGIIPQGMIGHREKALVPSEGDLAKAKEFLEKAGVSDLQLTIDCDNSSLHSIIAQTIQAQLSQIGIAVQVNSQDTGSYVTIGQESEGDRWKDVQLFIRNDGGLPDPYYYTAWFTTAQVGIWNWARFRSSRYDELNDKAITIEDPTERAKLYYEMQDLLEDSGAYRFLTNGATPVVYRTTRIKAATRPDGVPLYVDFKPPSA